MPDMLVLKRDKATGGVAMLMELDNDPQPAWKPGPTPTPNWHRERLVVTADQADADWFVESVVEYVQQWDPVGEVVGDIDWRRLRRDLEAYAWDTAMESTT